MNARAKLALIIAGPVLASAMTVDSGTAFSRSPPLEPTSHSGVGTREKGSHVTTRRVRGHTQAAARKPARRDTPAAFVGTLDDGFAYDTPRDSGGHPIVSHAPGAGFVGVASWYGGPQWQGRRMSNGNRYDQDQLTAAQASLPLGTLVRVTRIDEDRSVVVKITDRIGTPRRVIDLSRAAAARLGILSAGLARVRLDPL